MALAMGREIPDYLLCPITIEMFKNPVITPCGITYERVAIVKHLAKCGSFDPVTRTELTELTEDQLLLNRLLPRMNGLDTNEK